MSDTFIEASTTVSGVYLIRRKNESEVFVENVSSFYLTPAMQEFVSRFDSELYPAIMHDWLFIANDS